MTILERLRGAHGPDRELDADIAAAVGEAPSDAWTRIIHKPGVYDLDAGCWIKDGVLRKPKPYTASIDAALALVERMLPGRDIAVYAFGGKEWRCIIGGHTSWPKLMPAPLAILTALFAALEAKERT